MTNFYYTATIVAIYCYAPRSPISIVVREHGLRHDFTNSKLAIQQLLHLHPQLLCHSFCTLQGEVALSSFYASHVGTVYSHEFGEGFLAEAAFQTVGAQIRAHCLLEVSYSHAHKTEAYAT